MSTIENSTKSKIDVVLDMLNADLKKREKRVEEGMLILECMNASKAEYKAASRQVMINSFAIKFLKRVLSIAETRDVKSTESFIRFHAHYLHVKATASNEDVSTAQCMVAMTLESIIEYVFNN